MATATKLKVSLTLSTDLVALVDRDARRQKNTRSGVVELWLRRAATAGVDKEIEEATVAYYLSLGGEEQREDEAMSRALSRAARRVSHDEGARTRGRAAARRRR